MSLDVFLTYPQPSKSGLGIFIRDNEQVKEITRAEWDEKFPNREPIIAKVDSSYIFSANITHNLGKMADAAGVYQALWRPEEIEITTAYQLVEPLIAGLNTLKSNPEQFKAYNPPNGWGKYETLIEFIEEYLQACEQYPMAEVNVSR